MMGLANTTDVIMSIAILIATIIAIANIAIKIYSNAILNYGTKMGIKDIIKMYKEKQTFICFSCRNYYSICLNYIRNIFKQIDK